MGRLRCGAMHLYTVCGEPRFLADIDILIIGRDEKDWKKISEIAYEIDFENRFRTFIITTFLTNDGFEYRLKAGDPFISNVLREGIVLYDMGVYERFRKSMHGLAEEYLEDRQRIPQILRRISERLGGSKKIRALRRAMPPQPTSR